MQVVRRRHTFRPSQPPKLPTFLPPYFPKNKFGNHNAVCGKWIKMAVIATIDTRKGSVPWKTSLMLPSRLTPWMT